LRNATKSIRFVTSPCPFHIEQLGCNSKHWLRHISLSVPHWTTRLQLRVLASSHLSVRSTLNNSTATTSFGFVTSLCPFHFEQLSCNYEFWLRHISLSVPLQTTRLQLRILASSHLSVDSTRNNSFLTWWIFVKFRSWIVFRKFDKIMQVLLQSDKNNICFTWRPLYAYYNISLSSS
jgi:hypothetical protein